MLIHESNAAWLTPFHFHDMAYRVNGIRIFRSYGQRQPPHLLRQMKISILFQPERIEAKHKFVPLYPFVPQIEDPRHHITLADDITQ